MMKELPDTTKTTEHNYSSFKGKLDNWLEKIPDRPGQGNSILKYKD